MSCYNVAHRIDPDPYIWVLWNALDYLGFLSCVSGLCVCMLRASTIFLITLAVTVYLHGRCVG